MPKICKNTKITENAKYHQKGQISPKMPKIAQNAKTKKSPGMPYTKKKCQISPQMPKIAQHSKITKKGQKSAKVPIITKQAKNQQKCQNVK